MTKKEKEKYESKQNVADSISSVNADTVLNTDVQHEFDAEESEQEEDVYKLFLFYPDGIENTDKDKVYKLTDAELLLDIVFDSQNTGIKKIAGKLKTTYLFPDTKIGDMRTWRFRFYDVIIKNIQIDSSSDFLIYDIEADGFDVNMS